MIDSQTHQATLHPLVFVSGLSGSGLSSVLKTLEDFGFEAFDNYPLSLLPELLSQNPQIKKPIALGVDTRSRDFNAKNIIEICEEYGGKLIFITCDTPILLKRFTETRRKHPLAINRPLKHGIEEERQIMAPIIQAAHHVIDTTTLNIHDLRHILESLFKPASSNNLILSVMSFGFKHGTPREADIILDARFLQNPHWDKTLKPMNGRDKAVQDYIMADPEFENFFKNLQNLIAPILPRYAHEGKNYLTIAIGCTGGQHRSVFIVEKLGSWLKSLNHETHIEHRDLREK